MHLTACDLSPSMTAYEQYILFDQNMNGQLKFAKFKI